MNKKFVIKIKTPSDETLDKVRLYVSLSPENIVVDENKVYDDAVIGEIVVEPIADKKEHHFLVEYYSSTSSKVLRPVQPIPRTIIRDMGPWELLDGDKILQGDEQVGILENNLESPAYPYIPLETDFSRAWYNLMREIGTPSAASMETLFVGNPSSVMWPFLTNGEIYLAPVSLSTTSALPNQVTYYDFLKVLENTPAEKKRFEVNGFIWEIEWLFDDIVEKWLPWSSVTQGSSPNRYTGHSPVTQSQGMAQRLTMGSSYGFIPRRSELATWNVEKITDEDGVVLQEPKLSSRPFYKVQTNLNDSINSEQYTGFVEASQDNSIYYIPIARYIGPA